MSSPLVTTFSTTAAVHTLVNYFTRQILAAGASWHSETLGGIFLSPTHCSLSELLYRQYSFQHLVGASQVLSTTGFYKSPRGPHRLPGDVKYTEVEKIAVSNEIAVEWRGSFC